MTPEQGRFVSPVVHQNKSEAAKCVLPRRLVVCVATAFFGAVAMPMSYGEVVGPQSPSERAKSAYDYRVNAAKERYKELLPAHSTNTDDALPGYINSYTKGLPHDANGVVDPTAYLALKHALSTGNPADFESIPYGGPVKLRNPQAAYSFLLEGKDPAAYTMPAPPSFGSAWQASDAIEVMWQALTRDVAFADYGTSTLIGDAVADMNDFTDYRGPKSSGAVTRQTLFRGIGVGELDGPYISQFLYLPVPQGAMTVDQKLKVPVAEQDFMKDYLEWLNIQRGGNPTSPAVTYDATRRYIRNGRDLAEYVLKDYVNQAYLNAALILGSYGNDAIADGLPYKVSVTQANGPLFSVNHAIDMLTRVAMSTHNQSWYQKWLVHRRARPEVFFGRVHVDKTSPTIDYGLNPELLSSSALTAVFAANGTYLLPQASRGGSPTHPSYPAGHATNAGAAVTILKAFFKGSYQFGTTPASAPKIPNTDGTVLENYSGSTLTVEGELNKLASNISLGRDTAGVHYRSDGDLGLKLGEDLAISVLQDYVDSYNEDFGGFAFNRFDGTPITIAKTIKK